MSSRTIASTLSRIVHHVTRRLWTFGTYRYRVVSQTAELFNLQPVNKGIGLDSIDGVSVFPGVAGAKGKPKLGTHCLVQFVDGDRKQPYISAFVGPDDGSFIPTEADLDATANVSIGATASQVSLAGGSAPAYVLRNGDKFAVASAVINVSAGTITGGTITLDPASLAVPGAPGAGHSKAVA